MFGIMEDGRIKPLKGKVGFSSENKTKKFSIKAILMVFQISKEKQCFILHIHLITDKYKRVKQKVKDSSKV